MYLRTRGVGRNGTGRDRTGALQRATGERWRMSVVRRALRRSWREEEKGEERSSLACMQQTQHKRHRYISSPSFPFFTLVVMYFLSFSSPSNCRFVF
ncbi:unnamed protein product [Sphagnum balticum]